SRPSGRCWRPLRFPYSGHSRPERGRWSSPVANLVSATTSAQSMRMKLIGFMGIAAALLLPAIVARAGALPLAHQVGDTYEITLTRDSAQLGSDRSSGSSHDKDTIIERVIGLRADGVELEYDLTKGATAEERAGNWQFPRRFSSRLTDQRSCSTPPNSRPGSTGGSRLPDGPAPSAGTGSSRGMHFASNAIRNR